MNTRPLYIFDIDCTLANLDHRLHYMYYNASIHGLKKDFVKDRQAFFTEVEDDAPIEDTIRTLQFLQKSCDIWFWTGRGSEIRGKTLDWIRKHIKLDNSNIHLTMRAAGDRREDIIVKQEMLDNIPLIDRARLVAVFEDRQQVVDMWRENGITCYQVCKGDY